MSLQTRNGIGAIFEIYYFIQPKTTGMRIINDTLEQVRDFQRDDLNTVRMESDSSKLTKNLDDQNLDDRVKVVPLYVPDDALVKVFMMHSSHKSALANAPFAAGFRRQETVALFSIGSEDLMIENDNYASVRTLAKQYIKLIKSAQRTGPYYLAGFSFGGILSYEVACQLRQDGEDIAMVTMLDTMSWLPKSFQENEAQFEKFQHFLLADLKEKMVARFLRSTALGRLGFTLVEFERLMNDLGSGERLCTALEERAKTMNVSLGDVRGHVTSLKDQSERACHAHLEWQPPEVKYEQTISYIRCQNVDQTKQSFVSWDLVELWESLTNNIDVITLPSSHFELLDQPYAEICGLVIMTTAVMKHRNLTEWQPSPRSNQEERLINFLKSAVEVLISYDDDFFNAKLWLSEEEKQFSMEHENEKQHKKIEIQLNDIRNIIPGKYAMFHSKTEMKQLDQNLIISLMIHCNQKLHIICQDERQRDYIMDAFEVLFGIPLIRFHY
ncbi:Phthiocerol synthesis polyketide synthase type I [Paramuricea clavata]|uniref:oleoyl-[acyl-carrier-protein] hydrolase n=1 Tax=Paramuricea clavata TaxID=317549 RepID=A0A6S7J9W8_PARCT|nr:Phthiocerol synthesis polyketide synthase type I [Paramuricea clavata]